MFNQYQPNLENLQQYMQQENERQSGDGPNWWSFPAGMSAIRILPPWDPTGRVALPVFMHPIEFKGAKMSFTKYNWTCVNKTFNKPCPICEGLAEMSASGVDVSNYEANRRQFYFNAIVMHDPTFDNKGKGTAPGTHVLLKSPKTFYDWVIAQITNPMIGDITSVTNGIDVYVTKEGQGLGTEYKMTLSPNGRTAIPQEYLDKITNLYNLDEIFSAGFDKEQIDELMNHLKKSAGAIANGIPNAVNQMAGYQQPMTAPVGYPNPMAPNPMNAVPPTMTPPQFNQTGVAPIGVGTNPYANPYAQPVPSMPQHPASNDTLPWEMPTPPAVANPAPAPVAPVAPAPQESAQANMPKCYGQYDPGNVNCVVCPVEMNCSKSKNG